jgi:hypothetical protein
MLFRIIKNLITLLVLGPQQKCRRDCPCNGPTSFDRLGWDLREDYRYNNGESSL